MMARNSNVPSRAGYRSARPTTSRSSLSACNARPVHTDGPCADIRQNKKGGSCQRFPCHYVLSLKQMRDLGEYLRAYVAYVSANLGWGKALRFVLVWLAGMFLPLGARTLVQLPEWVPMTWMIGWALLGYIFAPYGMWKHHRAQIANSIQPSQKEPR